ncbi:MAG: hypothetical protein LBI63_02615 [Candidatus Ancillula sp.]|jgi:hypothetical protein|nr:hypothetical protein [Candidatus Ancillula sp.]
MKILHRSVCTRLVGFWVVLTLILGISLVEVTSGFDAKIANASTTGSDFNSEKCKNLKDVKTVKDRQLGYSCLDNLISSIQANLGSLQVTDAVSIAKTVRQFMDRTKLGIRNDDGTVDKLYPWQDLLKEDKSESELTNPVDAIKKVIDGLEKELQNLGDGQDKEELTQQIMMYNDAKNTFQLVKDKKFDQIGEHSIEVIKTLFGDAQSQRLENLLQMTKSGVSKDPNSKELDGVDDDARPIVSSIHWLNEGGYSGWMKLEFADYDDKTGTITTTKTLDKITTSDGTSERALNCAIHVSTADLKNMGLKQGQIFRSAINVRAGKDSNWSSYYRFDENSTLSIGYMTNGTVFNAPTPNVVPVGSFDDVKRTFSNTQTNILKLIGTVIGATIVSLAAGAVASFTMGALAPATTGITAAIWTAVSGLVCGTASALISFAVTMTFNDEKITDINLANQKANNYDWKSFSESRTHYAPYKYADYGYGKDFYGNFQISRFSYVNKGYYSAKPIINWKHCSNPEDDSTCKLYRGEARDNNGNVVGYHRLGKGYADIELSRVTDIGTGIKLEEGDEVWITAKVPAGYDRWTDGGPDDCSRSKAPSQEKCTQREHFAYSATARDMLGYMTQGATYSGDQKMHLVGFGTPEAVEPMMEQYLKDAKSEFMWTFLDVGISIFCSTLSKYLQLGAKFMKKVAEDAVDTALKTGKTAENGAENALRIFPRINKWRLVERGLHYGMKAPSRLKVIEKKITSYASKFDEIFYTTNGRYPSSNLYAEFLSSEVEVNTNDPNILGQLEALLKCRDYAGILKMIKPEWIENFEDDLANKLVEKHPKYFTQGGNADAKKHLDSLAALFRFSNDHPDASANYLLGAFGDLFTHDEQKSIMVFAAFMRICANTQNENFINSIHDLAKRITADLTNFGTISSAVFEQIYTIFTSTPSDALELNYFKNSKEFANAFSSTIQSIKNNYSELTELDIIKLFFICEPFGSYRTILDALFTENQDMQYFKYMDLMVKIINDSVDSDAVFSSVEKILKTLTTQATGKILLSPEKVVEMLEPIIKEEEIANKDMDIDSSLNFATTFIKNTLYNVVYITSYYADNKVGDNIVSQKFTAISNLSLLILNQIIAFGDNGFGYSYDSQNVWDSLYEQGESAITRACDVEKYWKSNNSKLFDQIPVQLYTDDFGSRCDNYGSTHTKWINFQTWSWEYMNYNPRYSKTGIQTDELYTSKCEKDMNNYYSGANYDRYTVYECKKYSLHHENWFKTTTWFKNAPLLSIWWNDNRELIGKYKMLEKPIDELEYATNSEKELGNFERHKYIKDIMVVNESNHDNAVNKMKTAGAEFYLDVDLNRGVKGSKDVYIGFTTTDDKTQAVTDVLVQDKKTVGVNTEGYATLNGIKYQYACNRLHQKNDPGSDIGASSTCNGQPTDLNSGAGIKSDYIYLYEAHNATAGKPLVNIGVEDTSAGIKTSQLMDSTWHKIDVDLNKGAGGDYIYLYKRHSDGN